MKQPHEGTTVYDTTLEGAWPVANVRQWKIFQHRVILPPISLTLSRLKFAQFFSTFLQRPMKGQMNVGELTQEDERKPMCLRFSTLFFLLVCSRPCPADYAALAQSARQSNSHLSLDNLLLLIVLRCSYNQPRAQLQVLGKISSTWQLVTGAVVHCVLSLLGQRLPIKY